MQSSPVISLSPSFIAYSSSRLADIAARVVEEFRAEADDDYGYDYNYGTNHSFLTDFEESLLENRNQFPFRDKLTAQIIDENKNSDKHTAEEEDEEEFEFAVVSRDFIPSPTPWDEIFHNGQIRPCFPLFNQDLLLEGVEIGQEEVNLSDEKSCEEVRKPPAVRLSLRKLFIEDREPPTSSSCSSSEADELDGVRPDTYCVWNPKTAVEEARCKKSCSTGSSKRWRFRSLLHRSTSDGKDSFVFLTHSRSKNAKKTDEKVEKNYKFPAPAP